MFAFRYRTNDNALHDLTLLVVTELVEHLPPAEIYSYFSIQKTVVLVLNSFSALICEVSGLLMKPVMLSNPSIEAYLPFGNEATVNAFPDCC